MRSSQQRRLCLEVLEARTVPTAVALPSNTLSWWAGNGNATDQVGPNNGTLNSGVTFGTGEVSSAFQFNNTSYVSAGTAGLPTGSSDRTLEMWVKVNSFGANETFFAGYGQFGTGNATYHLGTLSDHRLFFSQWGQAITGPPLQTGQWYHVAVTNVGNSITLYLNGSVVATGSLTLATAPSTQFYIGRIAGTLGDTRQLNGLVDEVSVYKRALGSTEIQAIYEAGSSGKLTTSPVSVNFPWVLEGAPGTSTPVTFTITRTGSLTSSLTVDWTTADDSAIAGSDYVAALGQVTFASGEATKTVQVMVTGDHAIESTETFKLLLTPAGGTSILGLATIGLNDPLYPNNQWGLDNTGQPNVIFPGGKYDVDIDMPAAWSVTTGKMTTVVAVIDDGVDYTNPDIYLNIWLNQGEIPAALRAGLTDTDGDGIITFRDLNAAANANFVTDINGNGYIDGGDLLHDPRWADGIDQDGNGKVDDLIGWDFQDNDNDPMPGPTGGHGTWMAQQIGGIPGNGIGAAGVNWQISMMPVRIHPDGNNINYTNGAAGLDYAVAEGAPISNNSWGNDTYSQAMYDAINRAKAAGHLFVAAAGNQGRDTDVTPFYPADFNLDNIISAGSFDPYGNLRNNWGQNSVDLAAPTPGGTSGSTAATTGVAALLKTLHPDWSYVQLKDRIMSTVEPSSVFSGITVSGGRLNAAFALAQTSISISDPVITEGDSGTQQLVFTVTRVGDNSSDLTLNWFTADGTATAGSDYTAASGQITFVAGGSNTQTVSIDIKGDTVPEPDKNFYVDLDLVSGSALMADNEGQGTILDNDTKFYVINDSTTDQTYTYTTSGSSVGSYNLNSGDTSPLGAAANAAGTKVWVVDANKTVYIYNPGGGLIGSWTAGGMSGNPQVDGIATNGTDIWILDSFKDKVYKYAGAATRTSGSQNAASSFSLSSSNTNAKGIVTDGASFWVVNDGSTDTVYKYNLSGSLLGSWTIDSANSSPTGLTLNPNSPSDIWIVDSGTKKVYQYTAAASRTSGSQGAAASFALAANNTNPQDIADPPLAETLADATFATPAAPRPPSAAPVLPQAVLAPPLAAARTKELFRDLLGPVSQLFDGTGSATSFTAAAAPSAGNRSSAGSVLVLPVRQRLGAEAAYAGVLDQSGAVEELPTASAIDAFFSRCADQELVADTDER
jgi:hypothetical protein